MFEHGPADPGTAVGCGIDHAHVHLVPAGSLDLTSTALREFSDLAWRPARSFSDTRDASVMGVPYLYVESPGAAAWIATGHDIPSQALRRILAAEQGRPDEYDWKAFPRLEMVQETIASIRAAARCG